MIDKIYSEPTYTKTDCRSEILLRK